MIVQFESLEKLISTLENNTGAWKELCKFEKIDNLTKNLHLIDSLIRTYDTDGNISLDRSLTIASHLQGKSEIEYLYILPVNNYLEEKN